jgi:rare lipoprotein A
VEAEHGCHGALLDPSRSAPLLLLCESRHAHLIVALKKRREPRSSAPLVFSVGGASWYSVGKRTASGELFQPDALTAAHRSLPFGTRLKVVYSRLGRSVIVRVKDRGPFVRGRVLDLSRGAARAIGMSGLGVVTVVALD